MAIRFFALAAYIVAAVILFGVLWLIELNASNRHHAYDEDE